MRHSFELTITGRSPLNVISQLEHEGLDDAVIGTRNFRAFADFDREAPTLLAAIVSAMDQIQSVAGLRVSGVAVTVDRASDMVDLANGLADRGRAIVVTGRRPLGGRGTVLQ